MRCAISRRSPTNGGGWGLLTEHIDEAAIAAAQYESAVVERTYRLLERIVRIRYGNAEAEHFVHPALAHLEADRGASSPAILDVTPWNRGYRLLEDGNELNRCASASELMPIVHSHLMVSGYRSADYLLAIHAGAVRKGDACVLLPAKSGGGKSTLTAALVHSGLDYLTDEVALLLPAEGGIRGLPLSMSLKEPVWELLSPMFPRLRRLREHRRQDARSVRYLPPPPESVGGTDAVQAKAIVFPHFIEETCRASLAPVPPGEALFRISEAGYDVDGGRLNPRIVGEAVNWIRDRASYELRYNRLEEAVPLVQELLA